MNDDEFIEALESCRLAESDFGHCAHLRAGYLYLRAGTFGAALERLRAALRNYAGHLGRPQRYHETITVASLALIAQHLSERGDGGGWPGFLGENPELLEAGLLLHFYPRDQLESELARRVFVLPRVGRAEQGACASL